MRSLVEPQSQLLQYKTERKMLVTWIYFPVCNKFAHFDRRLNMSGCVAALSLQCASYVGVSIVNCVYVG
jgi:hypothetical protein